MKLMILDGNSIVNRAFYGIRMLNAPDGTPTNAVYGFLTIFQRIRAAAGGVRGVRRARADVPARAVRTL